MSECCECGSENKGETQGEKKQVFFIKNHMKKKKKSTLRKL